VVSDARAQQAREHHRDQLADETSARRHRDVRDRLVKQLRAEDPGRWTYTALAKAVGCSPELIAAIIKDRVRRPADSPRRLA
jgi:hypothetical protein